MSAPMKLHLTFCRLNRLRRLNCLYKTNISAYCNEATIDQVEGQSDENNEPSDYLLPRATREQMYRPATKVDEDVMRRKHNYRPYGGRDHVSKLYGSIQKFDFGFSNNVSRDGRPNDGHRWYYHKDDPNLRPTSQRSNIRPKNALEKSKGVENKRPYEEREQTKKEASLGLTLDTSRIETFGGKYDLKTEKHIKTTQKMRNFLDNNPSTFSENLKETLTAEGSKCHVKYKPSTLGEEVVAQNHVGRKSNVDENSSELRKQFDINPIEVQYFGKFSEDESGSKNGEKESDLNYIEHQYFGERSVETDNVDIFAQTLDPSDVRDKQVHKHDEDGAKEVLEKFPSDTGLSDKPTGMNHQQNVIEHQYFSDSAIDNVETQSDPVSLNTDTCFIDRQYFNDGDRYSKQVNENSVESLSQDSQKDKVLNESFPRRDSGNQSGFIDDQYFSEGKQHQSTSNIKNILSTMKETFPGHSDRDMVSERKSSIHGPVTSRMDTDHVKENEVDEKELEALRSVIPGTSRMDKEDGILEKKDLENDLRKQGKNKMYKKDLAALRRAELLKAEGIINEEEGLQVQRERHRDFRSQHREYRLPPDVEKSSAALAAEEIRFELNKQDAEIHIDGIPKEYRRVDSMGGYIMSDQVPDFSRATSQQVVDILAQRVIYDKDDIVAIDKPYGLRSQGGGQTTAPNIADLLEMLGKKIDRRIDKLHIIHRLDKETTGVMLFAKSQTMADKLRAAFKERNVIKKYWLITKGVPNPLSGIIDIPIGMGDVGGRSRMVLLPDRDAEIKSVMKQPKAFRREAITRYSVMQAFDGYALVECILVTGLKHQIRAHMFYGLNCTIIGDNKYAHIDKMAPVVLPTEMLHRLNIRQSKARHLPMHLHARSLIIPNFLDGRNFFIECTFPPHWIENCKRLKIKLPSPRKPYSRRF
ncbi:hypothetical protein FSP39_025051 [Pinctada imbricata]|uniref:Pseudouridylate synthase RPUSD4, mitochondrial n=1 Tax=Pinctada imbricata TaxID=66713 RepID=A0AA88XIP3_PINIB|nr:hypothetical protein FSP39_025051 [Pinctada imbricata]